MNKVFYYNADDIFSILGYDLLDSWNADSLKDICDDLAITLTNFPYNIESNTLKELWQRINARYNDEFYFRIEKPWNLPAPEEDEVRNEFKKWIRRYLNFIAQTHDYYSTLLGEYASAKSELMSDIVATSKNKVKFNDTPQNPNTAGVYEGDDYITHFTATEGETKSPLMSKMMRLKEIQDHYKDMMETWCNLANKLFIEEANV